MNTLETALHALSKGGWVSASLLVTSVLLWTVATLRFRILRQPGYRKGAVEAALIHEARDADAHHHAPERSTSQPLLDTLLHDVAHILLVHRSELYRVHKVADKAAREFSSYRRMLESLVLAAPLLGLLGTVGGMIDTFDSLQNLGGTSGEQSAIAAGISRALVTTQLGLVIGVPGLLCSRLLMRLERNRRSEVGRTLRELLENEGAAS